jgi:hypothetical protein
VEVALSLDEAQLLEALRAGDEGAFEQLVLMHHSASLRAASAPGPLLGAFRDWKDEREP